eukprot:gene10505-11436_t
MSDFEESRGLIADGLLVGCFPTIAMIIASFLLTKLEVPVLVEAALQNFAAGLIIAAVAAELFPVMVDSEPLPCYAGVSGGFVIGLSLIYGVEHLVSYLESSHEEEVFGNTINKVIKSHPKGFEPEGEHGETKFGVSVDANWNISDMERASKALGQKSHRDHIIEHLHELLSMIQSIQDKASNLMNPGLLLREQEEIAELIDEAIHSLQYKVDHTRRLLQGSEALVSDNPMHVSTLVSAEKNVNLEKNISGLRLIVEHILEHIQEPVLDRDVVREMRIHIDHMDKQISLFHESIESAAARWHVRLPKIDTNEGDTLPMGLVMPVCLDSFVDGFLIGISSVISIKAGIILSFANCLEMSFLGMAYSSRLKKCTGSTILARNIALYTPPLIMLLASGLGAALGSVVQDLPALFIGMVAFGAVALLFLVCNELLIEARLSQGDDDYWFISIMVFIGIYLVLMLNHIL